MTWPHVIYLLVFLLWLPATIQGLWALWGGVRFYRYVRRSVEQAGDLKTPQGRFKFQPPAAVFLPCCGVDEKLHHTVEGLARQRYDEYQVIFTFESAEDPAYAAVGRWTADWPAGKARRVVAGLTQRRSQKIQNLLAAIGQMPADREVMVFLDSDAIPGPEWIGHLVAPLVEPTVGAATGYRWYCAEGGVGAGVRCNWNAGTVTLMDDERLCFCWGGATAILRRTFETLDIPRRWDRALSDDYQVTRAVRDAGLRIRFVPQALIPSHDRISLAGFWSFARRQVIITRICAPVIWRAGMILCCNFIVGGTSAALLFLAALLGLIGDRTTMLVALAGSMTITLLASGKAALRQMAIRLVLGPPHVTWRDFLWDVGGVNFSGPMHLALLLQSMRRRSFVWRNTEYEMISPDETRVIRRVGQSPAPAAKAAASLP